MAYFIRTIRLQGDRESRGTLIESRTKPADHGNTFYYAIPGIRAHRWVRAGGIHETGLYLDMDGRIRKAEAERQEPVRTQVFKQGPGADIEPGWYWVRMRVSAYGDDTPDGEPEGPYLTKRAALMYARQA